MFFRFPVHQLDLSHGDVCGPLHRRLPPDLFAKVQDLAHSQGRLANGMVINHMQIYLVNFLISILLRASSALLMVPVFMYAATITKPTGGQSCNIFWPFEAENGTTTEWSQVIKIVPNGDKALRQDIISPPAFEWPDGLHDVHLRPWLRHPPPPDPGLLHPGHHQAQDGRAQEQVQGEEEVPQEGDQARPHSDHSLHTVLAAILDNAAGPDIHAAGRFSGKL